MPFVAVMRWELDALLKCLGGCLQGMSLYDAAAYGTENTATDENTLQPQTPLRSVY